MTDRSKQTKKNPLSEGSVEYIKFGDSSGFHPVFQLERDGTLTIMTAKAGFAYHEEKIGEEGKKKLKAWVNKHL